MGRDLTAPERDALGKASNEKLFRIIYNETDLDTRAALDLTTKIIAAGYDHRSTTGERPVSNELIPLPQTVQYGIAWGTSDSALETHFEREEAERRRDWLNDPERMDRLIERGYELPVRVIERDMIPKVVGPWREVSETTEQATPDLSTTEPKAKD